MMSDYRDADPNIVNIAREFAAEIIEPQALSWEQAGGLPREFFRQAAKRGLCGLLVPKKLGASNVTLAAVLAEMASSCFAATFGLIVHNNLGSSIAVNGSQKHLALLPEMIAGEKIGAFLLTEPGAGSDAGAIAMSAKENARGAILNGEKAWITNGALADVLAVYVQTGSKQGANGIASYLLDTNDFECQRSERYDLAGARAMNVCGFNFQDVEVDQDCLMIEAGRAFKAAMGGIDTARAMVSAMCCGITRRALEEAVSYTKARKVFGGAVAELQVPQHVLADVSTDLEAADALTERAVIALDNKSGATIAAAHAKKFSAGMAMRRIADCMQMMGAAGALGDYPLARHLACAKLAQIVDGTSEIQNVVLSRALFSQA